MKVGIRSVAVGVACFLALALTALAVSPPDGVDTETGIALAASGKAQVSNPHQAVLYEAARHLVTINAYGFSKVDEQDSLLSELRATLAKQQYRGRVVVQFFPPREYTVEKRADGVTVSKLKRNSPTRRVDLTPTN